MRAVLLLVSVWFLACSTPATPVDGGAPGAPDGAAMPDAGVMPDAGLLDGGLLPPPHAPLPAGLTLRSGDFATGSVCGECHSATATTNVDERGRPVGLFEQWSATPMANATRDPFFRAALANEIARAPAAADAIAGVCLTCHASMGRHAQLRAGVATTSALPSLASDEGALARDGVSCTVCHQIQPTNLGQDSSFSGGYLLGTGRQIAGPYAAPFAMPMVNRSGFTPVEGRHVQDSALCGTCHTLVTEALTPSGVGTGHHMGEQLTYLEWRRSAFSTEGAGTTPQSCQSCHLPDGRDDGQPLFTRLAHRPDGSDFPQLMPRGPFSRHVFVGANTLLPKVLRQGRALLNPIASDAALTDAEALARATLRTLAARVTVHDLQRASDTLTFTVRLENLTGHKFPTGYPSRRAFLHVRVLDGSGALLFESGAVDAEGRLTDTDGRPLGPELRGGGYHPHRLRVTGAGEVAVYEAVMDDGAGAPSFDLLGAEGFLKDDRLLPKGHVDTSQGPQSTAPVGVSDGDFRAGFDDVRFELALSGQPARLEVRLRYQTFAPRSVDELLVRPTPEASALRSMLQSGALAPELVDEVLVPVP